MSAGNIVSSAALAALPPVVEIQPLFVTEDLSAKSQTAAPQTEVTSVRQTAASWSTNTGPNDISFLTNMPGSTAPLINVFAEFTATVTITTEMLLLAVAGVVATQQEIHALMLNDALPLMFYDSRVEPLPAIPGGFATAIPGTGLFLPPDLHSSAILDFTTPFGSPFLNGAPGIILVAGAGNAYNTQCTVSADQIKFGLRRQPVFGAAATRVEYSINGATEAPPPQALRCASSMIEPTSYQKIWTTPSCGDMLHPLNVTANRFVVSSGRYITTGLSDHSPFVPHGSMMRSDIGVFPSSHVDADQDGVADNVTTRLTAFGLSALPAVNTAFQARATYEVTWREQLPFPPFGTRTPDQPYGTVFNDNILRFQLIAYGVDPARCFQTSILKDCDLTAVWKNPPAIIYEMQSPPAAVIRPMSQSYTTQTINYTSQPIDGLPNAHVLLSFANVTAIRGIETVTIGNTSIVNTGNTTRPDVSFTPIQTPAQNLGIIPDTTFFAITCFNWTDIANLPFNVHGPTSAPSELCGFPILSATITCNGSNIRGQGLTPSQWYALQKQERKWLTRGMWDSGCYPLMVPGWWLCQTGWGQNFPGPNLSGGPLQANLSIGIPSWLKQGYSYY